VEYIQENVGKKTVKDIAGHLGKKPSTIRDVIQDHGFSESQRINERDKARIEKVLKTKSLYKSIKSQLSPEELDFFVEEWISAMIQFQEDMLPTEESELRDLIMIGILKNRVMAENREVIVRRERLEHDLEHEEGLQTQDLQKIMEIKQELATISALVSNNLKTFRELIDKSDSARKNLRASRTQRIQRVDDAKRNFTEWLRLISEYENRAQVGREMDIMKQSMEQQEEKLSQPYIYANNKIDLPVLNHQTIKGVEFDEGDNE